MLNSSEAQAVLFPWEDWQNYSKKSFYSNDININSHVKFTAAIACRFVKLSTQKVQQLCHIDCSVNTSDWPASVYSPGP